MTLAHLSNEALESYIAMAKAKILKIVGSRDISQLPIWHFLGVATLLYLCAVQVLRFRSLRKQTNAYVQRVILYEAPFMYSFSTQWALIKTYAVAPGTSLLVQTRQLTTPSTVGKRAEDTGTMITEFLVGSMDSDRGSKALAKMNWLHRRYGSKIKQPELLHTLAMFVLEPIRWFKRYEWRPITELEKVAIYTYWKEIGNRMGIKDIPETLEELEAWVTKYEETNVYFLENNRKYAEATMGLFLRDLPPFLRGFFQHAAVSLFEENVRVALRYEKPPRWIAVLTETFFQVRGLMIRHLFLPRLRPMDPLPKVDAETGRLHREFWAFEPWYVKTTFGSWLSGFLGIAKIVPGPRYKSDGFLPEELGPVELEKPSKEPVQIEAQEMLSYAAEKGGIRGCPFQPVGYPFKYGG